MYKIVIFEKWMFFFSFILLLWVYLPFFLTYYELQCEIGTANLVSLKHATLALRI